MKMMSVKVVFALLCTALFSLMVCSDFSWAGEMGEKKIENEEYVVIGALLGIPYWEDPIAGMEAAEKELGVKVTFIGPADWNAGDQVQQFQQVLLRKPSGIVIMPVDSSSVRSIIKESQEMNIPVITADVDAPDSGRLCYIGTDRYPIGQQAADFFIEKLNGEGQIGVITLGGSLSIETCLRGFKDRLAEKGAGIEIVAEADSKGDPATITNAVNAMIQGRPDLDGIFSNGTQETSSTITAVKQANMSGKLVLVGQGATLRSLDIMEAVKDGTMTASVTHRSFQQFYYAIKFLHDLNMAQNSNFGLSWAETKINPLPDYVDTGTMLITRDNVDSFYDQLKAAQQ
jgi:ribose transport system substrate-binding protein